MRYVGSDGAPRTREQSERQIAWFVRYREERDFGLWAVEERASGVFIGRIGLLYHDDWPDDERKTEVGRLLDRSYWGRGLAPPKELSPASATGSRGSD